MAEEFVGVVFEKAAEKLIDPIIRHFSYLFFYKSNIKSLKDGVKKLQNKIFDVKLSIDAHSRNLQVIGEEMKSWLVEVEENEKKAREVLDSTKIVEDGCLNGWFPSLTQRYAVSRKAVKQLEVVKELLTNGEKYTRPVNPAPPAGTVPFVPTLPLEKFESRISLTNDVIETLKNDTFSMIGVCGLGGVGKTTMAKQIRDRAIAENLCDEVAMAVVSENPNMNNIQDELASMLGLQLEEKSITDIRGKRLYERLTKGKRTLIILDDVWKNLNLIELGIPFGGQVESKRCKVLITTRNEQVCTDMGTEKNFKVKILSITESWDLFKEKSGIIEENGDLYLIAKKVSEECDGLPLAIVTVGAALKGKNEDEWKDALNQLQNSNITSIHGMEKDLYARLRLSYNLLENDQLRRLFLVCCTYPEDYDIPIEELIRYSTGMRLFKDDLHMEVIRRRVNSVVNQLKSCYLLLHSEKSWCVKVHDILRDFGIKEASDGEHVYLVKHQAELKHCIQNDLVEQCTEISISSNEELELPPGLTCPLLKRLTLSTNGSIQISKSYFGGMKGLNVVSFRGQRVSFNDEDTFLESPPKPLQYFMNVRTLCLEHCHFNSDIVFIGSMHKLEVLSFFGSYKIDVLPNEIGQLNNLKVLDLRRCEVGLILSGVLSSLKNIEELYMGNYFCKEGVEELNQGNCASILELCSLSALKTLQLFTSKAEVSSKLKDFFFDRLKLFDISINICQHPLVKVYDLSNGVVLYDVDLSHFIRERILAFLKTVKALHLVRDVRGWKNVSRDLDEVSNISESLFDEMISLPSLEKLELYRCDNFSCVIPTYEATKHLQKLVYLVISSCRSIITVFDLNGVELSVKHDYEEPVLGELKEMHINFLVNLRHIWRNFPNQGLTQRTSFGKLEILVIRECTKLRYVFSTSMATLLVNLKQIHIRDCSSLEEVMVTEEEEIEKTMDKIVFPKLQFLNFISLKNLKSFYSGSRDLQLPVLEIVELHKVQNMDNFCSKSVSTPEFKLSFDMSDYVRNRDLNYSIRVRKSGYVAEQRR